MFIKKILLMSALTFAVLSSVSTYAAVCSGFPFAKYTCGKGTVPSIKAAGVVTLDGTTVTGDTTVYGVLLMTDAHLNTLTIGGPVRAKSSTIAGLLAMSSNEAHFSATSLQSINVKPSARYAKVYLESGTVVNGSIVFQGEHGVVFESDGSKVLGNVTGGKIIKQ